MSGPIHWVVFIAAGLFVVINLVSTISIHALEDTGLSESASTTNSYLESIH